MWPHPGRLLRVTVRAHYVFMFIPVAGRRGPPADPLALADWRPGRLKAGDELQWRRKPRGIGQIPIEVTDGDAVLGRLLPQGFLGRTVEASTTRARWTFVAEGWGRKRCRAFGVESTRVPMFIGDKVAFRRRRVRMPSGVLLDWRQAGFRGAHYKLSHPGGPVILTARNEGGALRWRGTLTLGTAAPELDVLLPPTILFAVFLVFGSWEIHPQ